MVNENLIKCPKCGIEININEIAHHQIEDRIKKDYESKITAVELGIKEKEKSIAEAQELIKKEKENISETIQRELDSKIKNERKKLEENIRKRIEDEKSEQIQYLNEQLAGKTEQVKDLNKLKSQLEQVKNEKEELRTTLMSEISAEYNRKLHAEIEKSKKQHNEETGEALKSLQDELNKKSEQVKDLNKLKVQIEQIKNEKEELRTTLMSEISAEFNSKLHAEIEKSKKKHDEETGETLKSLQDELNKKSEQVKELYKSQMQVEQLKREKNELKENIEIEFQQKYTKQMQDEIEKIKSGEIEKIKMHLADREKVISDLKNQLDDAKRKAEQGSMQLQGETQEIALKEMLESFFKSDEITDVPTGAKGSDIVHIVKNKFGQICGKIIYESKRTKNFANDWISKLKEDALTAKADLCVIVTNTLPKDMERFGERDGVWICRFNEALGLACALREGIIRTHDASSSQLNRSDKINMLYDYLSGNEFNMQIRSIIESLTDMKDLLEKEKKDAMKKFAERDKQLEKANKSLFGFFGSVKGIAGASIPDIDLFPSEAKLIEEKQN